MTTKQLREARRTADRLDRAATLANKAYDDFRATFGDYTMGRDGGLCMDAARAADDAKKAAKNFRTTLDRLEQTA